MRDPIAHSGMHLLVAAGLLCVPVGVTLSQESIAVTPSSDAGAGPAITYEAPAAGSTPTAVPVDVEAMKGKPPEGGPRPPGQPPTGDGATPPGAKDKDAGDKPKEDKPAEGPKPVARPDKPTGPENPEAFKVRPDGEGLIQFQFDGAPWPPLIEWLGEVSGMAVDWQELPGDFVNLRTQRRYSLAETRDLVNRYLLARGYTLLQEGELLTVVKTAGINLALVPRVTTEQLAACTAHEFVKVSFELDWLLAEEAVNELKPLISKNGQLIALRTTNRLEAADAARNLQQIQTILQEEQSSDSQDRLLREFVLENVRAAHVREKLDQLLGLSKKPETPLSPKQQQQQQQMMQQMQQAQMQAMQRAGRQGKPGPMPQQRKEPEIQIVVNEQRNSVIIQAPPDKMVVIAEAVRLLDVPDRRAGSLDALVGSIRTYRLATLDPAEVVEILLDTGAMDPDTRLKVDAKSQAIIVSGPPWDHLTVEKLIEKLDGSPRNFKVVRLRRRRADQVATTIESLMIGPQEDQQQNRRRSMFYGDWLNSRNRDEGKSKDRFRVGADVEHNWLLLWCNEKEHEQVMELLAELSEIPGGASGSGQVRVIESLDPTEADELLRRTRDAFRSLAPNPVELPEPIPRPADASQPAAEDEPSDPGKPVPATKVGTPTVTFDQHLPGTETESLSPKQVTERVAGAERSGAAVGTVLIDMDSLAGAPLRSDAATRTPLHSPDSAIQVTALAQIDRRVDSSSDTSDPSRPTDPSPITVSRRADGRIVIYSQDAAALDVFEELLVELRPGGKDYAVFKLENASATWVVLQLEDFFEEDEDDGGRFPFFFFLDERPSDEQPLGLADRRPIRFITDIDTNTIVVRNATEDQLKTVAELIKLYDVLEPANKEKSRHTKLVYVKHSKASVIASQIKDVFRDLLSGNDKAFQQKNQPEQQRQRSGRGFFSEGLAFGDGDSATQSSTRASFKGKLSLGFDDTTNTLLVSTEGGTLMTLVVAMIEDLDQAAGPADDVRVVRLSPGSDYGEIREALRNMFGGKGETLSAGPQPDGKSPEKPRDGQARPPQSRPVPAPAAEVQ